MINYSKFEKAYEDLDKEDIIEIIEVFLSSSETKLIQLQDSILKEDYDTLEKDAHQMKGSLVHFFDEDARTLGEQLEYNARMKEPLKNCTAVLEALKVKVISLTEELQNIVNQLNKFGLFRSCKQLDKQ